MARSKRAETKMNTKGRGPTLPHPVAATSSSKAGQHEGQHLARAGGRERAEVVADLAADVVHADPPLAPALAVAPRAAARLHPRSTRIATFLSQQCAAMRTETSAKPVQRFLPDQQTALCWEVASA